MSIDVLVTTNRELPDGFLDMLEAAIPRHELILVGREFATLGTARQEGIRRAKGDLLAVIDDDVVLPKGWVDEVMRFYDDLTGWVEGWMIPSHPDWYKVWVRARMKDKGMQELTLGQRGFMGNTIVRTHLLKDWVPPAGLNLNDDYFLSQHVMSKGFKAKRVPVMCLHNYEYDLFERYRSLRSAMGVRPFHQGLLDLMSAAKYSAKTGNVKILWGGLRLAAAIWKG